MKVLNLYAGIGGNRRLWKDVEVTAIESERNTAKTYNPKPNKDVKILFYLLGVVTGVTIGVLISIIVL